MRQNTLSLLRKHQISGSALLLVAVLYFGQGGFFVGLGTEVLLSIFIPLIILHLVGRSPREFGYQIGDLSFCLKFSAVLLALLTPLLYYFAQQSSFREYYPHWELAYASWRHFALYHVVIAVRVFAGEALFRGYLLFGWEGKHANLAHSIVYMLVHIGKPLWELPYSFALGYLMGWANLRCKSILPSFLVHYLSNVIFDLMLMGVLVLPGF
ncbi:MAG: CPBP family intramembrane metalloprotease [Bdellovibrionales bacterium]|nr:CPBP family intramembrane metalloprotease [Bdellovibrionales bacterium]